MLTQKGLSNAGASRASILMKTGACVGGSSECIQGVGVSQQDKPNVL
jgi:hypothetical protein